MWPHQLPLWRNVARIRPIVSCLRLFDLRLCFLLRSLSSQSWHLALVSDAQFRYVNRRPRYRQVSHERRRSPVLVTAKSIRRRYELCRAHVTCWWRTTLLSLSVVPYRWHVRVQTCTRNDVVRRRCSNCDETYCNFMQALLLPTGVCLCRHTRLRCHTLFFRLYRINIL